MYLLRKRGKKATFYLNNVLEVSIFYGRIKLRNELTKDFFVVKVFVKNQKE